MFYCSARRLPRLIKLYLKGPPAAEQGLEQAEEIFSCDVTDTDQENTLRSLDAVLGKRGYRKNVSVQQKEGIFLYEQAKPGILGPHIIHLGLAVLLVSGIITAWSGTFYDVNIKEGEILKLDGVETRLILEKFAVIPSGKKGMADEYASRLRINRLDRPIEWKTLKVNTPLRIDGFRLYQTRYSYDIERLDVAIFGQKNGLPVEIVPLKVGERVTLPGLDMDIEVGDFVPDFAIDAGGNVSARSQFIVNPACLIKVFAPSSSGRIVYQGWIFRNFVAPHPEKPQTAKWKFAIDHIRVRNISGIKVTRNPGEYITYFGLALLVAGSFLSCYQFYRCLAVRFGNGRKEGAIGVQCFALQAKNMFEFERELNKIKEELRAAFNRSL